MSHNLKGQRAMSERSIKRIAVTLEDSDGIATTIELYSGLAALTFQINGGPLNELIIEQKPMESNTVTIGVSGTLAGWRTV